MPLTPDEQLRQMLGESIPDGGTDADTLFTNIEIEQFLENGPNLEYAALSGWRIKAARLASLVDTTEGNAARKLSQAFTQAQDMVKLYTRSASGPTEGRTRVGRIRRDEVPWS
jgi:hypothetical protein